MTQEEKADIAVAGLAVMGANLALNMESKGWRVAVYNRSVSKLDDFMLQRAGNGNFIPAKTLTELCASLKTPRKIMLMVKAGAPVDEFIEQLIPELEPGDIIIDGGNSHFTDTERRCSFLADKGIRFVGMGISGGEEGALHGPSIMPGGDKSAWKSIDKIFYSIAAQADGRPCCEWMGPGGAGHFVKMLHNGIEYADMQMIAESYMLLHDFLKLPMNKVRSCFENWNKGRLNSYLIEIAADLLRKKDPATRQYVIDIILDAAGQKGTGKWASESALELGIPAMTIAEAVFARCISALKEERIQGSEILAAPARKIPRGKEAFARKIEGALYASKICSYAQGFQLLKAASDEYSWGLNYSDIALIWRGGCIIRAKFLNDISDAYLEEPGLKNLMFSPFFRDALAETQNDWRDVTAMAVRNGFPVPAFSSALAYYDSFRSGKLPANMIQALRDYFGAHTYERIDRARGEFFHTEWTEDSGKTVSTAYNV